MTLDILRVLAGLALLTFAADRLVVSAARLSRLWGLSPILIGAVIVGLGTSLPEMLVSGIAAADPGGVDLALGNIVGSNIANLTLILGVTMLISPMGSQMRVIRREGMLTLGGSVLLTVLVWQGTLVRWNGILLLVLFAGVLYTLYRWSVADGGNQIAGEVDEMLGEEEVSQGREIAFGIGSLALTLLGAQLLVDGATGVADTLGISGGLIGLTLVALGTSLPELATAVAAARRHENDLVIGNLLGSNLFNAMAVGGVAAIVGNTALTADFRVALVSMLVVTVAAGIMAATHERFQRWEGAVLLIAYPAALAIAGV